MCILYWLEPNGISRSSGTYVLAYSAKSALMLGFEDRSTDYSS